LGCFFVFFGLGDPEISSQVAMAGFFRVESVILHDFIFFLCLRPKKLQLPEGRTPKDSLRHSWRYLKDSRRIPQGFPKLMLLFDSSLIFCADWTFSGGETATDRSDPSFNIIKGNP